MNVSLYLFKTRGGRTCLCQPKLVRGPGRVRPASPCAARASIRSSRGCPPRTARQTRTCRARSPPPRPRQQHGMPGPYNVEHTHSCNWNTPCYNSIIQSEKLFDLQLEFGSVGYTRGTTVRSSNTRDNDKTTSVRSENYAPEDAVSGLASTKSSYFILRNTRNIVLLTYRNTHNIVLPTEKM